LVVRVAVCEPTGHASEIRFRDAAVPSRAPDEALRITFVRLIDERKGAVDIVWALARAKTRVPLELRLFGRRSPGVAAFVAEAVAAVRDPIG